MLIKYSNPRNYTTNHRLGNSGNFPPNLHTTDWIFHLNRIATLFRNNNTLIIDVREGEREKKPPNGKYDEKMGGAYFNLRWKPRRKRNLALFFFSLSVVFFFLFFVLIFCFFQNVFSNSSSSSFFLFLFQQSLFFSLSSPNNIQLPFLSQRFQSTRFSMCPIPITKKNVMKLITFSFSFFWVAFQ